MNRITLAALCAVNAAKVGTITLTFEDGSRETYVFNSVEKVAYWLGTVEHRKPYAFSFSENVGIPKL